MELADPLLPGLSLVGRARIRIQVVRVDVEGDQDQRVETRGLYNWHVVGGLDGDAGDVGPRAGPDVGNSLLHAVADRAEKILLVESVQESEGVSSADEDRPRQPHGLL